MNAIKTPDRKYLEMLSREFPTIQSACTEIINLQAILNLPKGTEHFMSDIHGEEEAFYHILNNASGMVREKVDMLFGHSMTEAERSALCTLIYYPQIKLKSIKAEKGEAIDEWYKVTLYHLIEICRLVSSKYTRSKVRKALPKDFEYIIDELLHTNYDIKNKEKYYQNIIATIIEINRSDEFITALCTLIKRLIVDHLHIVGDIFDRGPGPHAIMDCLIDHHCVDIQWGNHDILWMGAAAGSEACILNVLYNSMKYDNLDIIEDAYGINLRPLAVFAAETYEKVGCVKPKSVKDPYNSTGTELLCKMMKATIIMMFKCEGQVIMAHPEYHMEHRLLLHKINYAEQNIEIDGAVYHIEDVDLPTVDPENPYALTEAESEVMEHIVNGFMNSEKLSRHMDFLYRNGSMYKCFNGNLLLHGCIPMNEDGTLAEFEAEGKRLSGKDLLDYADKVTRRGYYSKRGTPDHKNGIDFMWYLWCGQNSPVFGKDKMTTFERCLIKDEAAWKEPKNSYYKFAGNKETIVKVLEMFGLTSPYSHMINGHVPVKVRKGEDPVKAGGKLIVIDGGFAKAYQKETGIAGYTLFYNSYGLRLASHAPFEGREKAIEEDNDIISTSVVSESTNERITVAMTDNGKVLQEQIEDLKILLEAYRSGSIKETR